MFKNILLFILVLLLLWMSRDYFSSIVPNTTNIAAKKVKKLKKEDELFTYTSIHSKKPLSHEQVLTLSMLLEQDRFYEAIEFYIDSQEKKKHSKQILRYLNNMLSTDVKQSLIYMRAYLDEVEDKSVLALMIQTYIMEKEFKTAIDLIIASKENYVSEQEDKRLSVQLKEVALFYIDNLMQKQEYAILIAFLQEMIAHDEQDSFYSYRLALLYAKLDKVEEAESLLDVLQYDEVYAQKAETLLNSIDKKEEETYTYAIPLQRYGDHYIANINLDGTAFNLMLDTGATYIFIDEDKASMLEVIRDDLILQTAGNDVNAKLAIASSLSAGNLTLSNIKVTIGQFKRQGIDGLLGMNFLKQFRFYINQEKSTLYLNAKDSRN